jgi:hypothetical protein
LRPILRRVILVERGPHGSGNYYKSEKAEKQYEEVTNFVKRFWEGDAVF